MIVPNSGPACQEGWNAAARSGVGLKCKLVFAVFQEGYRTFEKQHGG